MSKPFKIAFIGAGGIAHHHVSHMKKVEGVEIVAAADVSEKSLAKFKDAFNVPHVFTDYKQMLKEVKDIDAVDVCTPNGLHAENTIAALAAGKHVMVEKPMAMNAREAQRMLDAAKAAGKELIVGFQQRFDPKTKVIRDQILSGSFGKIHYVRAQALRRRGIPNWGVFGRKDLQGGGPMIDIGVHLMEAAHYMMGSPRPVTATGNHWTFMGNQPSSVASMWPGWDHATYTVEDFAAGMIRFDEGSLLTIEASFVTHIEKDVWNIQVYGERGGANWETSQIFTDHGGYMMNMTPGFVPKWDHFEYKMKHFVEVCRDGRTNESPGEHGLMVQKMLDGVYASAAAGKEVPIE
ncbi:MAG: Gfo/Idh/MocA family oxidoreductase [Tepidisphaeraceae bacterium]